MIHTSPDPPAELQEKHYTHFLLDSFEGDPNKPRFIDGKTGKSLNYLQLKDHIYKVASSLSQRLGLHQGDTVAIFSPNHLHYPTLLHSVTILGGIVTTINPAYTSHEVTHHIKDSGAKYIATIPEFLERVAPLAKQLGVRRVIALTLDDIPVPDYDGYVITYHQLYNQGDGRIPNVVVNPKEDVVLLPYSSGTTGLPKGVMLTHFNLVSNYLQAKDIEPKEEDAVSLGLLPFFHMYGNMVMNAAMTGPASLVIVSKFDFEEFLSLVEKYKITTAALVPPIVVALAKHPAVKKYNLTSLRKIGCGAAALGDGVAEHVQKTLNVIMRQGFGMTELTTVGISSSTRRKVILHSVGHPIPNTECKIVDPATGQILGYNQPGELLVRGPQVMKGYHNNPKATAETIDSEGWLHTGDVAYVDEEGYFYIIDRLKELIKYKGFQVAPAELEAILLTNPKIADAAVIGVPDEDAGEIPKAFIVKRDPSLTHSEVKEWVAGKVAYFKKIQIVDFVDSIPKSPSGKILRKDLRVLEKKRRDQVEKAKL